MRTATIPTNAPNHQEVSMKTELKELFDMRCAAAADDLMHDGELQFQLVFLTQNDELIYWRR